MTVSSVATGYDGISLLAGNTAYDPSATFLIQRVAGTGASATITFSSIPSTYKHLQIRVLGRTSYAGTSDDFNIRLNGSAGTNYAEHGLSGNGGATGAFGNASQPWGGSTYYAWLPGSTAAANLMGVSIIDIIDYQSTTKYKTIRGLAGTDANGSGQINLISSLWMSTSAVNSVSFHAAGSFTTATSIALYGIKG
jgi:hypothetical protein